MNVIGANITCWRDSLDFRRRASRGEYWWFWMTYVIFLSTANLISNLTGTLVMVLFALPTLSATWRRLHDTGRSGWKQFWALTFVGIPFVLWWLAQPSQQGENRYGQPPQSIRF